MAEQVSGGEHESAGMFVCVTLTTRCAMSVVTTQTIRCVHLKVMCSVFTSETNQLQEQQTRGEDKPRQDKVEHESAGMYNVCMTSK